MKTDMSTIEENDFVVKDLSVKFGDTAILEKVSFSMEKGSLGVLLGLNGAGKTSLIRAMTGLIKPCEGEVYVEGLSLKHMKRKELAKLISYVPQNHYAVYNYSVHDFILMGRTPYLGIFGIPCAKDLEIVQDVMEYLGINGMENRNYISLSSGERQMVLLARALVQKARVMVMDEPTTYLDYQKQHCFLESLKKTVKAHGIISVISLHDPNLALEFADKIMLLHGKKVLTEVDCKDRDYISKFHDHIKIMYGDHIKIKKCENDVIVLWRDKQKEVG